MRTRPSTAVSAAMNLQTLEPNRYLRKQKFSAQVLLLSAILMTVNSSVFATNDDHERCDGWGATWYCSGATGATGAIGEQGLNAYQQAVENGFDGTVVEWLASLKGANGTTGANGISAYQLAVNNGYAGTITQWLASLKGANGADGTNGITPEEMAAADTTILNQAKTYINQVGQQTLNDAKAYTDSRVNALNRDLRDLEDRTYAAVASSIAIAFLPQPTEAGMSMVSGGIGFWEGEQGYAFGVSGVTENNKYVYKVALTGNSQGDFGGGASVGYQWK